MLNLDTFHASMLNLLHVEGEEELYENLCTARYFRSTHLMYAVENTVANTLSMGNILIYQNNRISIVSISAGNELIISDYNGEVRMVYSSSTRYIEQNLIHNCVFAFRYNVYPRRVYSIDNEKDMNNFFKYINKVIAEMIE